MTKIVQIAGVVLRNEQGRYLLVQEGQGVARGLWNLPAGHVDKGETPQAAAVREAGEETGYRVKLLQETPILIDQTSEEGVTKQAFIGKVRDGRLAIPKPEITDAQWFTLSELEQLKARRALRTTWGINSILKAEAYYENSRH